MSIFSTLSSQRQLSSHDLDVLQTTLFSAFEYAPPTSNEQSAFDTARLSTETLVASSSSAGDLTPLESMPPPALARVEPDDQKTERIEPVRVAQELEVMDQPSPPAPPPFTDAAPSSISDGDLYRELIMPVSEDTEMSRLFQMGVSKFDENVSN